MTDTNKILGQATVDTATASALYTVPEGSSTVVASLFTTNTTDTDCAYSVYAVPNDSVLTPTIVLGDFSQLGSDIDGEAPNDQSGRSVSLSSDGSVVAIGAPTNDGNGSDSGHVRVYLWSGSSWVQLGADIDGESASDLSGFAISLSGDGTRLAVGASSNDGNGNASGHVRVFEWSGSSWVQLGVDIDGEASGDASGAAVSLSANGQVVAIGAPENDATGTRAGHVRVYEWTGSTWSQLGSDIDGEAAEDFSGTSVSLSSDGSVVAIGAPNNDGGGNSAGHVRVYEWNGSAWVQKGGDIDGAGNFDYSGHEVSLTSDGNIVAIGAPQQGINPEGQVRVYEWNGSGWVQRGSDIVSESAYDETGGSVSISSDGAVVAVGYELSNGSGASSGQVRIFEWSGSAWVQRGPDIDGEAAGDKLGTSVSLSSDGSIVAIGAMLNDGNGISSGHVRVYEWSPGYTIYSVPEKHAIIESQSILTGEHHEAQGGIMLGSGDAIWIAGTDEVSVSLYGVEIS